MDAFLPVWATYIQIITIAIIVWGVITLCKLLRKKLRDKKDQEITAYLIKQENDDKRFIQVYALLMKQIPDNGSLTGKNVTDLVRLNERIDRRRNDDDSKIKRYPSDVKVIIRQRHPAWTQIQNDIAEILGADAPK